MPVHLNVSPQSRRKFLVRSIAGGLTVLSQPLFGSQSSSTWALLSDTHIAADPSTIAREVNMAENLQRVREEILTEKIEIAGAILNGDCAYLTGQQEDYQTLLGLTQPLVDAGLPLSFNMGNHDERVTFYDTFTNQRPEQAAVEGKHVTVIETPLVNWFLVDSMLKVNLVTGEIGTRQLHWLEQALDARADKPAVVMGHHNLQESAQEKNGKPYYTGIQDTIAFRDLLVSKKQVKAYIFGHTHNWSIQQPSHMEGLHLVNLPPVAYVFDPSRPSGWVRATPMQDAMMLELRALDPKHPEHGVTSKLAWRRG